MPEIWIDDDAQLDAARALLDAVAAPAWRHWVCRACRERIDGPFDQCWSLRRSDAGMKARAAFLMTLPPLMWAGNAVVGRLLVGHVPPLTLNFMRWALAALLLAPLGWPALRSAARHSRGLALPAGHRLLGVGAYNALQYLALTTSTPLNVTLIAASSPLWMLAVGALAFGQRVTPRQIAGALSSRWPACCWWSRAARGPRWRRCRLVGR